MLGQRHSARSRRKSLLADYSTNLGELMSRRQSEAALRSAKIESDMASRTKSEFLANMSHELRTPLNAIIGFSEFIQHIAASGKPSDKTVEYAEHIAGAGRHLLNIISDILDISKIESGTFQLSREEYDLRDLIEACTVLIEPRIRDKRQVLEVKADQVLPVVPVDVRRIKQVLINLLSNAHKFTGEGGRIVLVATRTPDGGATIAVADTGIGMTKEQIDYAMTPFGQVQSSYARGHEGTGLGLPIAAALTKLHGGEFQIHSEPGRGTTVFFTLPPARPGATGSSHRGDRS
ncbi:MAG: HAMP domain-containing histidine kinase [Alphaproteobacteria bacterium]|nr:HAMP domain-containing histidine kinase [Alphaproteobacteria bacterium]MDX5414814.1 HAMP domain-containing histidine kinase [Alphaproteobacteria bacterium]MDX5491998.1 HAMP domain-containing histidine kinase [Alphaproteobacteria bacterium]